jgi:phosphoglycolate phosphatase-like HAD superfamily hydrolase
MSTLGDAETLLGRAAVVFWDFDGVIKESVTVKTAAFEQLFAAYGPDVAQRVRLHHEAHGGLSRYDKIPLYLGWTGESATSERVQEFCDRFSGLVLEQVVACDWVPGVRDYLESHHHHRYFVLLTATPQPEIEIILRRVGLTDWFRQVHGAPAAKPASIGQVLSRRHCDPLDALVVGDSETDLDAALAHGVPFLLRRTVHNETLQRRFSGPSFNDLGPSSARTTR